MTTLSYRWSRLVLAAAGVLSSAAGCGDVFVGGGAGGGSGGTGAAGGGAAGAGGSGLCDENVVEECYSGGGGTKDVGLCKHGTRKCTGGTWGPCDGEVLPVTEVCDDGADNDCDGHIDEECPCTSDATQPCYNGPTGTAGVGACKAGTQTCTEGVWGECKGAVAPSPETCDNPGSDDDCDGTQDNLGACDTGLSGDCAPGLLECSGGVPVCQPTTVGTEICDGKDNNCDGQTDETFPTQGAFCNGGSGACAGTTQCVAGVEKCVLTPVGSPEICDDGADNNCDGVTDPPFTTYFGDTFSALQNLDWELGIEWQIGPAIVGITAPPGFFPDPAVDATLLNNDNRLAGVNIGGDASTAPHPPYHLTSKAIDLGGAPSSVVLSFQRFLNSDVAPAMTSSVEVFDGTSWVLLWQNASGGLGYPVQDANWIAQSFDVTALKNPSFRVRFGVAVANGATPAAVGSWSIDDVRLSSCIPKP